ncbi:MAG TPA: F0F1 ATP synthase subunit alpha, partial [Caulobacteraceae bacterium]|nr:F0F1 ATP synthase subunit alpha [Caulobacteraceae bacterium]
LARGERLTELLKQPQYAPQSVEEQVVSLYAGTRGYLDGIAVSAVGRYQTELLARLHSQHQDLLDAIRTKKALDEDLEGQLKAMLDAFATTFA